MEKCSDFWCERYDETRGNCDRCIKEENENGNSNLRIIIKDRIISDEGTLRVQIN